MDGPWQSSANRYYAFSGDEVGLVHGISKTPPPQSASYSRSSPSATCNRKSAPPSPTFGPSTLLKSSLLDRISPKVYSPQSRPMGDPPPLSPELGDYLDAHLDEEEEEQVIRVLDNNQELVYQRDFGVDERQDRDGDLHDSRNSSPMKKRKLVHPNQPTNKFTPNSSPVQNKPNQKVKRTRSRSRSPPHSRSNSTSPSRQQLLASRLGVDWSSGSTTGSGSTFGKRSGLTFGFAGYEYDTSAEVNTTGKSTLQDRIEATHVQESLQDDTLETRPLGGQVGMRKPSPPPAPMVARDRSDQTREPSIEEVKFSGGTSLLRRIGSFRPISNPELEVPREGGEQHISGHEADHEEEETIGSDAFVPPPSPPSVLPLRSGDLRMDPPPPHHESPSQTPKREEPPEHVAQPGPGPSSRLSTSLPEPGAPLHAVKVEEGIKSMEEHAEDLLQDIHKEFLSKYEMQVPPRSTELERITPGFLDEESVTPRHLGGPLRVSPSPILDGISPLVGGRFISPLSGIDHHDIASDAMSIYTHTPRSTVNNLPGSISRSTSFPADGLDSDILLEVDPEVDQIAKQALGDLIVHSLKINHNLGANEGWENSDAVRRAIKQEVDEHARDFLRLAAQLGRRMGLTRESRESAEVSDIESDRSMAEPIHSDMVENGHPENLPPIEGSVDNKDLPAYEGDVSHVSYDVEMDPVPSVVPQPDPEGDRTEPNDVPTGDEEPRDEHTDEGDEHVDHVEYAGDGACQESSGLEIPGVWCARTGQDRTDTIREQIEVSEAIAARVRKWVKGNVGSGE